MSTLAHAPTLPHGHLLRGRALVLLAGAFWSIAGLLVRMIDAAGPWQILTYRSLSLVVFLLVILALRDGGRPWAALRRDAGLSMLAGLFLCCAFSCYILALTMTTVANVLFLLTAAPLLAAGLGRVVLGERVRSVTWAAMLLALLGVGIMAYNGLSGGNPVGDLLGLGAAFGFAGFTVTLRKKPGIDMLPSVVYGGLLGCVIGTVAAVILEGGLMVGGRDLLLCFVLGSVQLGAGLVVYTFGARHLPAAECVLLSLSEVVLGALWVWIFFAETPTPTALAGGAVLCGAILLYALSGLPRRRPPIGVV